MKIVLSQVWHDDRGVLSFEWVLLVTLLTIGIVSGITAARDAIIDELADVAEAAVHIDQSFILPPDLIFKGTPGFSYTDSLPNLDRCNRGTLSQQGVSPSCNAPRN